MTQPTAPCIPETAPFTPEQRAWLNGFLAGLFARASAPAPAPAAPVAARPLTILWGSQTGTAEKLAKQAAKTAAQRGFTPRVLDMAAVEPAALADAAHMLVITSTYGDGEPPDNARSLHASLRGVSGLSLGNLRYSVCALGDRNYTLFCQCGRDFDEVLAKLGAQRVADRVECDLDYEEPFTAWLERALASLAGEPAVPAPAVAAPARTPDAGPAAAEPYSRKRPFPARVLAVRRLTTNTSAKEVNHVELSLEGSGLTYETGDALGVVPQNCPDLVDEVLAALGCDGEEPVATPAGERPLRTALLQHFDLGKPSPELLQLLQLEPAPALLHVIDALLAPSARRPGPDSLAGALRKLQPRLYSISSSPRAHPGQVHLTVGAVRYDLQGRSRKGACSTFLAERALAAGQVGVFIHSNTSFRPPTDAAVPMIMIGPGTGIAPFRAFLQERQLTRAPGRNWLFFGDQHAASDFLYREELEGWVRDGLLTRLDTAFSRDQAEKIYVQHRMLAQAADLWSWLEAGAHVYVCGDASRMARDVDAALHRIVEVAGGRSPEDAAAYVRDLRSAKRYARDVY